MRRRTTKAGMAALALTTLVIGLLFVAAPESAAPPGQSRLVSVQHIPEAETCMWDDALRPPDNVLLQLKGNGAPPELLARLETPAPLAALQQRGPAGNPAATASIQRPASGLQPVRVIRDLDPTYSSIGLDLRNNEIILQDNNLWSYRVFGRTDNTPPAARFTEPKRIVSGDKTEIQFNNGLYVDPKNGDIYSVESDVGDKLVVFPHDASGNVAPKRKLHTMHRVYNIAVDEPKDELFVTVEFPPEVDVYRKEASGEELPIRRLFGPNTGLNSVHGIAIDEKNQLLYVNTWGHYSDFTKPGTGKYEDPAIKVYPLYASGDMKPLRVIQGDKTQLDWPGAMKLNPENGDMYVANDIGQSLVVFSNISTANGNVAPARAIKGPKTKLSYPTGVALDLTNREVWVSNMGAASATVYPLMANGDVAPLRIVRSALDGKKALNFGRTTALAYDSKREELLVPN
jgi:6-phosphogluconolactonase (cycloisomerase 2 family)